MKALKKQYLTTGTIVAMNLAIVVNLYGFPSEAFYGLSSIVLYLIGMIVFLVPVALVSAELGSMYPNGSGIFTWVKNAFNYKPGLVASWIQWIQSILFYPLTLTFAAVTICYISPDSHFVAMLSQNKVYIILFTLVVFWGCTFLAKLGMNHVGRLSSITVWTGIVIPVALLIGLTVWYVAGGGEVYMDTNPRTLIPDIDSLDSLVLAASIILYFSGLEVNGVHVYLMKNPARNYPKSLFLTCIVIGLIYILGTLSIAIVIPTSDINLTESVIVAFKRLISFIGCGWFCVTVIALAVVCGVIANTLTWINGPSSVVKDIATLGYLPKVVSRQNKHGAPMFILYTQGVIVTGLMLVYVISPAVQQGYQLLLQTANALYVSMYLIFYVAFLRLRYKSKDAPRPFRVGHRGNWLAWVVASLGICGALFTLFISFFPPAQLDIHKADGYVWTVIVVYLVLMLPPFLYLLFRRKQGTDAKAGVSDETLQEEAVRRAADRAKAFGIAPASTAAATGQTQTP